MRNCVEVKALRDASRGRFRPRDENSRTDITVSGRGNRLRNY